MHVKKKNSIQKLCVCLVAQLGLTLWDPMDCSPPGSSVHGYSPGKNIAVGHHALLQGIFPTQGSIPGLPHCRPILYQLSHKGSPSSWPPSYSLSHRTSLPHVLAQLELHWPPFNSSTAQALNCFRGLLPADLSISNALPQAPPLADSSSPFRFSLLDIPI